MGEMKSGSRLSVHCSGTTEGGGKRNDCVCSGTILSVLVLYYVMVGSPLL